MKPKVGKKFITRSDGVAFVSARDKPFKSYHGIIVGDCISTDWDNDGLCTNGNPNNDLVSRYKVKRRRPKVGDIVDHWVLETKTKAFNCLNKGATVLEVFEDRCKVKHWEEYWILNCQIVKFLNKESGK